MKFPLDENKPLEALELIRLNWKEIAPHHARNAIADCITTIKRALKKQESEG